MTDFRATTSRYALIMGMTNTDQIGMWQARAPQAMAQEPEVIPDADAGSDSPENDGEERDEATGLTAAELAEFEGMRQATPAPTGDEPADEGGDDDDGEDAPDESAVRPDGREPAPREGSDREPVRTPKTVNYSKYQRELKRANEALATANAERQKLHDDGIKLAERVRMIDEALRAQAPVAPPAEEEETPVNPFEEEDIDPNVDYAAAVQQVNRRARFQYEQQQSVNQEAAATNEDRQLKDTFERDFRAYAGTAEGQHVPAAYQFLKDSRLTEICISEFDKDPNDPKEVFTPQEVQRMVQMFNQEEKWVVGQAVKMGKSPAAAIMKLARARGFRPPVAQAPPTAQRKAPVGQPLGREVQPAPRQQRAPLAPQQQPDATQQLAALREGVSNGRSLSDGGGAPPQGLSAEMILKLDDNEFAEMLENMSQYQLDALMGRAPL